MLILCHFRRDNFQMEYRYLAQLTIKSSIQKFEKSVEIEELREVHRYLNFNCHVSSRQIQKFKFFLHQIKS